MRVDIFAANVTFVPRDGKSRCVGRSFVELLVIKLFY